MKIGFVALLLSYLAMVGCSKTYQAGNNNATQTTGKLKQIKQQKPFLYTNNTFYTNFSYDNNNRVATITQYTITLNGDSILDGTSLFYYTGNNMIPDKIFQDGIGDDYWHYFTYDLSGKLLKDSSVRIIYPSPVVSVTSYQYTGNSRIGFYASNINYSDRNRDSLVTLNDNPFYLKEFYDITNPYPPQQYHVSEYLNYDNNVNPIYLLNIGEIFFNTPIFRTSNYIFYSWDLSFSKNNCTKILAYDHTGYSVIRQTTSTYNKDNYPLKRLTYGNGNGQFELIYSTEYYYY